MTRPILTTFSQVTPLFLQQYERYLPTAFDPSLTLLEKVDKVIQKMGELGNATNGMIDKWNEIMEWIMGEGLQDSVNVKLEEWLTDGTLGTLINDVLFTQKADLLLVNQKTAGKINVMEKGAIGDGVAADDVAIQNCLNLALDPAYKSGIEVIIPDGSYLITSKLKIYRNTTLRLSKNAKMLRGSYNTIIINGNHDDGTDPILSNPYDPYSGHGNILIDGGIWDGNILNQPYARTGFNIFGFCRGRNITVQNAEIRDVVTCHAFDLNAMENILIKNCKFKGYVDATIAGDDWYPRNYVEAIQISNILDKIGSVPADGTPCKNIRVEDCYFGSSGTLGTQSWCVGVGSHTAAYDTYNENINVVDCVFDANTYAGVRGLKWKTTKVRGNHFKNCRQDVSFSNSSGNDSTSNKYDSGTQTMIQSGLPQSGRDLIITENTFENTLMNILWIKGQAKDGNVVKFNGIVFDNNNFIRTDGQYSSSNLLDITWCSNVRLNNFSLFNGYRGIIINNSDNVKITNGRVQDTTLEGIYVTELDDAYRDLGHTFNIDIMNVIVKLTKYTGILMYYTKSGKIRDCWLESIATQDSNTRNGITVAVSSDSIEVENNKVRSGSNMYGIQITSGATNCRLGFNEARGMTAGIDIAGSNLTGSFIHSPNGTRYLLGVDNAGNPTFTLS